MLAWDLPFLLPILGRFVNREANSALASFPSFSFPCTAGYREVHLPVPSLEAIEENAA